MTRDASRLTLMSRHDCGLCAELARDLRSLGVPFATVDIDADADLLRRFDEAVPVLLLDGVEVARAPVTQSSLRRVLRGAGISITTGARR